MAADPSAAAPETIRLPGRFWLYWTASVVSWMGDGLLVLGIPLLAASITHSPLVVALVLFAQRLPLFLFSIPLGAVVDRWNARRTTIVVNVLQALVLGGAGALAYFKHFPLAVLFVMAFAMAILETIFLCADGALMGDVVRPELFGLAGTRLMAANSVVAYVAGPAIGALLFTHGRHIPLLIDAATFVLASGMLLTLRVDGQERELPPKEKRDFVKEVRDGLKLISGKAALRLNAIVLGTLAGLQAGSVGVYVLLGTREIGLTTTTFGVATAAGNLVAPFFLIILPRVADKKLSTVVALAIVAMSAGEILMGTATTAAQLAIGLALDGTAVAVAGTALRVARMRLVPRETLGRMTGAVQTLTVGSSMVGILIGGGLATWSLRAPYLFCGVTTLLMLIIVGRRFSTMNVVPETGADASATSGEEAGDEAETAEDAASPTAHVPTQPVDTPVAGEVTLQASSASADPS